MVLVAIYVTPKHKAHSTIVLRGIFIYNIIIIKFWFMMNFPVNESMNMVSEHSASSENWPLTVKISKGTFNTSDKKAGQYLGNYVVK